MFDSDALAAINKVKFQQEHDRAGSMRSHIQICLLPPVRTRIASRGNVNRPVLDARSSVYENRRRLNVAAAIFMLYEGSILRSQRRNSLQIDMMVPPIVILSSMA